MRYVEARYEQEYRDTAYRFYVTNSLQNIPQQKFCSISYADMINPKPKDNRTGDEIAIDFMERAGLTLGGI